MHSYSQMAAAPRPSAVPLANARPTAGIAASPSPPPSTTAGSGTKTLLVSPAIPDKSMVYHNHVYVNPNDAAGMLCSIDSYSTFMIASLILISSSHHDRYVRFLSKGI
jgi:hypothetical protein